VVTRSGHHQLFGGEARDDLAAVPGDDYLFFDTGGRPAVRGGPEGLEGEDHAFLDDFGMVERHQAAEDGLLPDVEADAVPVLQRERQFLIGEPELLGPGPDLDDLGGRHAGLDEADGVIEQVAALVVRADLGPGGTADHEGPVITGAVTHVTLQYVEVGRVTGAQHPVRGHVRVGGAALAADGVDALYHLGAMFVEELGDQPGHVV